MFPVFELKHFKKFYLSPYFLSLVPFLLITLLIKSGFNKYLLEIKDFNFLAANTYIFFDDVNNDGSSERIIAFDQPNAAGIAIRNDTGVIEQWNLKGSFNFLLKRCLFISGDKDDNGIKEIYVFTLLNDTIFLNCISDFNLTVPSIRDRIIAISGPGIKNPDPFIIPAEMQDQDHDGIKELIFGIGSGFSKYPRNVFAYFISKDSLAVSPESFYYIGDILQTDINGDGQNELIPYGQATSNVSPQEAKYHDYSSFYMVLDQSLNFMFDPVEFRGKYSILTPFTINTKTFNALAMLFVPHSGLDKSRIYFTNSLGIISDSLILPLHATGCQYRLLRNNMNSYLLTVPDKGIGLYDDSFNLIKKLSDDENSTIIQKDLDLDGNTEILMVNFEKGTVSVSREGFNQTVNLDFKTENNGLDFISFSGKYISIQSGQYRYLISYRKNPKFPLRFLFFLGIYSGILGFALITRSIQKNQIRSRYENEKKISQLQLALIRNQLEPHFALNTINSIIYSIENSGKEAGDLLRMFANLYRNLLLSAGSIQVSLAEEVDFCKDYLALERKRYGDEFDYNMVISDEIAKETLVPKLLIQIYLENAIKHGLSSLREKGLLEVNIKNLGGDLLIEITDNGVGRRQASGMKNTGTGKGLNMMNELYQLYNKYYDVKINSEIIDLYLDNGQPAGTKVILTIKMNKKNERD